MAGVCDYYAFGLALRAFGAAAAGWALLFQVLSWFNFYCLVRPYSNSMEAVLATAALFHWAPYFLQRPAAAAAAAAKGAKGSTGGGASSPVSPSGRGETCALLLAALCVAVRPTSAALWVRRRPRSLPPSRVDCLSCPRNSRPLWAGSPQTFAPLSARHPFTLPSLPSCAHRRWWACSACRRYPSAAGLATWRSPCCPPWRRL